MRDFIKFISTEEMRGQIRHIVNAIGAIVAYHTPFTSTMIETYIGLMFLLMAMYDSYRSKKK